MKSLGDGLMAAFTSPVQAVACAVAMQQAVHRHNAAEGRHPFQLRVGLHVGEPLRDEGDYFGTPVVVAKRLCDSAEGGQILASEVVRSLVGSRRTHAFRSLGDLALRGISEPLPVCSVEWESLPTQLVGALPAALLKQGRWPFVGREAELKRLRKAWADAGTGRRRLVMVAGEPGIGKTRLCSELAREVVDDGGLVLYGRCDEESVVPYQPFVEALRQLMATGTAPGLLRDRRAELAHLLPELAEQGPSLADARSEDPETERYRLFEAVASLLTGASRRSSVLLVLDDLHWAAQPTLLLLRHLLHFSETMGVLVVGTYRDVELTRAHPLTDLLPALRREGLSERVHLSGLSSGEVRVLLAAWAGHEFGPEEVALHEELLAETEGNPFFILEITRHLAETGRLNLRDGRWVLEGQNLSDLDIPEGVRDVIGRRLSRLSETTNAVLAHAAILGREFDFDVLTATATMDDEAVLGAVEEALGARLLIEVPGLTVPTYTFTHALVREALLDELTLARKQRLHLRAAQAIESVSAGSTGSRAAALAVHYRQAGTLAPPEKAIGASVEAGREAARALAWEEVAAHWQTALDLMEERGADPAQRAHLLARLAALLFVTGFDVTRAIEHTEQALALYEELGQEDRAAEMRSRLGGYRTTFPEGMDVPQALGHLRAAEEVLGRRPESPALGYVYAGLAAVGLWGLRTEEGLAASRKAIDIGERHGTVPLWVQGHIMAGYHLIVLGSLGEGREMLERAWSVADEVDHRIFAMIGVWIRGGWGIRLSDPLDAAVWYERELAKPRLAQAPIQRQVLQGQLAWAQILSGDLSGGRRGLAEVSKLPVGENLAPPVELWEGDWAAAAATLRDARDRARGGRPLQRSRRGAVAG